MVGGLFWLKGWQVWEHLQSMAGLLIIVVGDFTTGEGIKGRAALVWVYVWRSRRRKPRAGCCGRALLCPSLFFLRPNVVPPPILSLGPELGCCLVFIPSIGELSTPVGMLGRMTLEQA